MSHFFISLCVFQQRATLTKQASFHQSKVSSWLHSSEEMSKCSKGAVCFLLFLSLQRNHHCIFILLFVFFVDTVFTPHHCVCTHLHFDLIIICWSLRAGRMRVLSAGAQPAAEEHGGHPPHVLGSRHHRTTSERSRTELRSL